MELKAKQTKAKNTGSLSKIFALVAVAGAMGGGICAIEQTRPSVQDGVSYLEDKGYTDVKPTGQGFLENICHKGESPRSYTAIKDGKVQKVKLCANTFGRIRMN